MLNNLKRKPAASGLFILLVTLFIFYHGTKLGSGPARLPNDLCSTSRKEPWESSRYLLGTTKRKYKDNLRNDTYYVTSWSNAGFTNQFMSYVNMIYLGTISDRIPIIPPFAPDHHISHSAGPLPFGEVFNLTELRRSLRLPILEWSELKAVSSRLSTNRPAVVEELGCWSTRAQNEQEPIRAEQVLRHLGLDVSYTRVPDRVRHHPDQEVDAHVSFFPLVEMIFPGNPSHYPGDKFIMATSPLGARLGPDVHMACFDTLYFVTAGTEPYEWKTPWSPAWRFVGRHLKFTDPVKQLATAHVRRALKVTTDELPPFITVHARRGDFEHQCWDVPSQCLAPLSAFVRRVEEVKNSLFLKHGLNVSEVLLTSDEKDPAFWQQVTEEGWRYIDHNAEKTLRRYGEWYEPLIDIVAQSLGTGFVGSLDSTVSIVTARRVEDWNHGVTRVVGWGGRD
ncbi:hypothetical protein L208DRAFT_1391449 [Tricholoma matsutake]|nr:hypothetical protein L208DRAFT_1391449 [Tricholoma matsutake 945]